MIPGRLPHFGTSNGSRGYVSPTGIQSHSLSQGYRADLPTSLGRVIFSLEVSCLGDLMRLSVRRPPMSRNPFWGRSRPSTRECTLAYSRRGAHF